MTDRIHSLTVVLEQDTRDDDCEDLITAIRQMRNVLSVEPHVSDYEAHMAQERALWKIKSKMYETLRELT